MRKLRPTEGKSFRSLWHFLRNEWLTEEQLYAVQSENDPPDFSFRYDNKQVGLEHTEVSRFIPDGHHRTIGPQHSVEIQRRVCDRLTNLFVRQPATFPRVRVSVTFGACGQVKRADEDAVAQGLFDVVKAKILTGEPWPITIYRGDLEVPSIRGCVHELLIDHGGLTRSAGRSSRGPVDGWGLPIFQEASDRKANDLPRYAPGYDECWLLIEALYPNRLGAE